MNQHFWTHLTELLRQSPAELILLGLLLAIGGAIVTWSYLRLSYSSQLFIVREQMALKAQGYIELSSRNAELKLQNDGLSARVECLLTDLAQERTRSMEQQKYTQAEIARLSALKQSMTGEFERLVTQQLKVQQQQFSHSSEQRLDSLLSPLQRQLNEFRVKVDEMHKHDIAQTHQLLGQIKQLQGQSQKIGEDAVALTHALKGSQKMQGNWGEWILQRLLEQSGLHEGREFVTQLSEKGGDGNRLQPDVVLNLPGDRHIVVDSKVSLLAYEAWVNSASASQKELFEQNLLQSIRQHIKSLSGKQYQHIPALDSLDFVVMFIPVEPAFTAALQICPGLLGEAYAKNVVLAGPTTLMSILRCIEILWQRDKQDRNVETIVVEAGKLHDHFVRFVDSIKDVGVAIERAQKAHEQALARLAGGKGNLIRRVKNLQELGAKTQKNLDSSMTVADEVS